VAIRRINRGSGHSYLIDDVPADGVTTVLNLGLPKPALINWAGNTTADYAVNHWDELGRLPVADRLATLRRARFDERDTAARRGTEVHKYAERLLAGEAVVPPEELTGHVENYLKFLDDWQIEPVLVERVVVHRKLRYCGTFDLVADSDRDPSTAIFDLKTARSGIYPETALQLAAYAYAESFIDDDGTEQDMPAIGSAYGVWVRGDGYDVIPLELSARVFDAFRGVLWLARVIRDEADGWRGESA
jgi:hypothetical protein